MPKVNIQEAVPKRKGERHYVSFTNEETEKILNGLGLTRLSSVKTLLLALAEAETIEDVIKLFESGEGE